MQAPAAGPGWNVVVGLGVRASSGLLRPVAPKGRARKDSALRFWKRARYKIGMRPRPAAALALVGWYLVTPPSLPNGRLDESAPIGSWDRQESYASSDECKNGRTRLLNLGPASGTTPQELAEMRQAVLKSLCIATDNPRLKEK